jgi:hypothetical protein
MGRTSFVPVQMACTTNMIRFHGVFAPNAKLRSQVESKKNVRKLAEHSA